MWRGWQDAETHALYESAFPKKWSGKHSEGTESRKKLHAYFFVSQNVDDEEVVTFNRIIERILSAEELDEESNNDIKSEVQSSEMMYIVKEKIRRHEIQYLM